MKKTLILLTFILFAALTTFQSCEQSANITEEQTPDLPQTALSYDDAIQRKSSHYNLNSNRINNINNDIATLGRVLFYDKKLSINSSVACASCHLQSKAFADLGAESTGFGGIKTKRNSPSIVNAFNASTFFWDARTDDLNDMVLLPVQNHIEMGLENLDNLEKKLELTSYYQALFDKAFVGNGEITKEKIATALSNFLSSMISTNSKFDQADQADDFSSFSQVEKDGMTLFNGNAQCASCHSGQDFNGWGNNWANIGLEMEYTDNGVGALEGNSGFEGVFKVPTLRNIAMTAPYMHDGRYKTLEEVINHYNGNLVNHPNLDRKLKEGWNGDGEIIQLNLSNYEKQALIAFLRTLTDPFIMTEERFANPFN
jgi:cytochrome c peroxidase